MCLIVAGNFRKRTLSDHLVGPLRGTEFRTPPQEKLLDVVRVHAVYAGNSKSLPASS